MKKIILLSYASLAYVLLVNAQTANYKDGAETSFYEVTGCTNSYEPNESLSAAKTISVNQDILGRINSSTDKDYLKFTLTSAKYVSITLTNLPSSINMRLYNSSGTQIGSSLNSGTSNETITILSLASGTYTIYLYGVSGSYNSSSCYTLRVKTNPPIGTTCSNSPSYEPNNGTSSAYIIPTNTYIYSKISSETDKDYYKFVLTSSSTVNITLGDFGNYGLDYDLYLLNSSSTTLGSSQTEYFSSEEINKTLSAGTYYVLVLGADLSYTGYAGDFSYSSSDCYKLRVKSTGSSSARVADIEEDLSGLGDFEIENNITLFPNPATSVVNLRYTHDEETSAVLNIYDLSGRVVYQQALVLLNQENLLEIPLAQLHRGIYFVTIQTEGGLKSQKLILE